jgi:hypothetical protein
VYRKEIRDPIPIRGEMGLSAVDIWATSNEKSIKLFSVPGPPYALKSRGIVSFSELLHFLILYIAPSHRPWIFSLTAISKTILDIRIIRMVAGISECFPEYNRCNK